jgi:hypothetical protein
VLYLQLIILSVGGVIYIDSEVLLMTDFMNIKIKIDSVFQIYS